MASFASAFDSSNQGQMFSNTIAINSTDNTNDNEEITNRFSTIDLDQQSTSRNDHPLLYVGLNDVATFPTDSSSTAGAIPNAPSFLSPQISSSKSFSSNTMAHLSSSSTDQRLSMPDMARLSTSSAAVIATVGPTIDKFKQWSRSTYKCTKQSLFEKLGKTTRTVDVELNSQIEQLRETKRQYENILALARSYANHFYSLMQTQKALSDQFVELKQKSFLLFDEFNYNAETQRLLARNGETLFYALNYFISTLNTLCTKTIEDTINTIRLYETSRLEYDACRSEMEFLPSGSQLNEKQYELNKYKERYEQLKNDINIKLKLLDDNQTKVMKQQLLLFHNAISAYFSGNKEALDATMKQFHLKAISTSDGDHEKQSFLEQSHH